MAFLMASCSFASPSFPCSAAELLVPTAVGPRSRSSRSPISERHGRITAEKCRTQKDRQVQRFAQKVVHLLSSDGVSWDNRPCFTCQPWRSRPFAILASVTHMPAPLSAEGGAY